MKISGEYSKPNVGVGQVDLGELHDRAACRRRRRRGTRRVRRRGSRTRRGGTSARPRCTCGRSPCLRADQRLDGALDELLARLGQHRDAHVVGNPVALDELADEVEVGLARGREADLDLLVAHPDEQVEHRVLAGDVHRVDQGLVAVAQVGRQPARRGGDRSASASAVGQVDGGERAVTVAGHAGGLLRVWGAGHDVAAPEDRVRIRGAVGAAETARDEGPTGMGYRASSRPRSRSGSARVMVRQSVADRTPAPGIGVYPCCRRLRSGVPATGR